MRVQTEELAMVVELDRLLGEAFFATELADASEALDRARTRYAETYHHPGSSFEVVAPPEPDSTWVRDRMVGPLLYFCQSTGIPVPDCPGIFVSLFIDRRLHCIAAYEVMSWAAQELHETPDDWLAKFGTHERETVIR
jgi:hypothetical protein